MSKNSVKLAVSVIISCLAVFILFKFRSIPVSHIWTNYSIVYYPSAYNESQILTYFQEAGCKDIVCKSLQRPPVTSNVTPVLPGRFSDYLRKRLSYFTDRSGSYSLLYIPKKYTSNADSALEKLKRSVGDCGIEGGAKSPWLCVAVAMAFYILLLVLSNFSVIFFFPSSFMIMLVFALPLFPVASGAILMMLAVFLARNIWQRKGALKTAYKNRFMQILTVGALCSLFLTSLLAFALSLVAICALYSSFVIMNCIHKMREASYSFHYTLIFSSKQIAVVNKKNIWNFLFASAAVLFLTAAFIFTSSHSQNTFKKTLSIPSPCEKAVERDESLAGLDDFYVWAWQILTFPYKNLHYENSEKVNEGDQVIIPRYTKNSGSIIEYSETLKTFDSTFIKEQNEAVLSDCPDSIEKLLITEGAKTSRYSTSAGKVENGRFGRNMVLLLLCAALCSLCWIYFRYSGRTK